MLDQLEPTEPESEPGADGSTLDRRKFLSIGAVALASAGGFGLTQRNETNGTNGSNGGGGSQQSTSGEDNEGNERENESESNEKGEDEKNDRNENDEEGDADHESEGDGSVTKRQVSLSDQQARDAATKRVSGTVQSVELGSEDGTSSYEVLVENGTTVKEVVVDANSGKVLKVESEGNTARTTA